MGCWSKCSPDKVWDRALGLPIPGPPVRAVGHNGLQMHSHQQSPAAANPKPPERTDGTVESSPNIHTHPTHNKDSGKQAHPGFRAFVGPQGPAAHTLLSRVITFGHVQCACPVVPSCGEAKQAHGGRKTKLETSASFSQSTSFSDTRALCTQ